MVQVMTVTSLALVPAFLSTAVSETAPTLGGGCQGLFRDLGAKGYSDFELAAYCRANLPPQACHETFSKLGAQPWAPERIGKFCQTWGDAATAAPGRKALAFETYQQLQQTVDAAIKKKSDSGICQNAETKKPLPMEECIKQKEEYATKVQEAMTEMSNQVMGTAWGEKGAPAQAAASKVEALGPIVAKSSTVGVLAGVGLLTALTVAGAAVAARRGLGRMQKSDRERTLVDSLESEEDGA